MGRKKKKRTPETGAVSAPLPVIPAIEAPALLIDGSAGEEPSGVPVETGEEHRRADTGPLHDMAEEREPTDKGERAEYKPEKLEPSITRVAVTPTDFGEEKTVTVLADDFEVAGVMKFKSSLMITGVFGGEIISEGLLIVGPAAKVTATITTKNLISYGYITGNVTASERVILKQTAVHTGDITTPDIVVESGSLFNGSCAMERAGSSRLPPRTTEVSSS